MSKFAIDTNILIYTHSQDAEKKRGIARNLIVQSHTAGAVLQTVPCFKIGGKK